MKPGSLSKQPGTYVIGVRGFRNTRFDTVYAMNRMRMDLADAMHEAQSRKLKPILIGDGLDLGVTGLAYREARALKIMTVGLVPSELVATPRDKQFKFPVDVEYIICTDKDESEGMGILYSSLCDTMLYYGEKVPTSKVFQECNRNKDIEICHTTLPPIA